jgi:hypothetical protein
MNQIYIFENIALCEETDSHAAPLPVFYEYLIFYETIAESVILLYQLSLLLHRSWHDARRPSTDSRKISPCRQTVLQIHCRFFINASTLSIENQLQSIHVRTVLSLYSHRLNRSVTLHDLNSRVKHMTVARAREFWNYGV